MYEMEKIFLAVQRCSSRPVILGLTGSDATVPQKAFDIARRSGLNVIAPEDLEILVSWLVPYSRGAILIDLIKEDYAACCVDNFDRELYEIDPSVFAQDLSDWLGSIEDRERKHNRIVAAHSTSEYKVGSEPLSQAVGKKPLAKPEMDSIILFVHPCYTDEPDDPLFISSLVHVNSIVGIDVRRRELRQRWGREPRLFSSWRVPIGQGARLLEHFKSSYRVFMTDSRSDHIYGIDPMELTIALKKWVGSFEDITPKDTDAFNEPGKDMLYLPAESAQHDDEFDVQVDGVVRWETNLSSVHRDCLKIYESNCLKVKNYEQSINESPIFFWIMMPIVIFFQYVFLAYWFLLSVTVEPFYRRKAKRLAEREFFTRRRAFFEEIDQRYPYYKDGPVDFCSRTDRKFLDTQIRFELERREKRLYQ